MKQLLLAGACVALLAVAPALGQSAPETSGPSITPSTPPTGCLPGLTINAAGQPCAAQPNSPTTSQVPGATTQSPGSAPSPIGQAAPSVNGPSPSVATSLPNTNFIGQQADNQMLASSMMGKSVQNAAGDKIGAIKDILFDDHGKVAAFVVGVGGFLGIGEKSVAIAFDSLKASKDANGNLILTTTLDKDAINAAPAFVTSQDLNNKK